MGDSRSGMGSGLEVRLLGELALSRDGAPVPLPASRKTRALFVYLLLDPRPHRRERLCELFWDIPDDPRGALRWSLSKIRAMLGDAAGWLVATRDHVSCTAPAEQVDLHRARDLLDGDAEPAALIVAAEAAREAALAGIDLPNLDTYSAWLTTERAAADAVRARLLRKAAALPGLDPAVRGRFELAAREADGGDLPTAPPKPDAQAEAEPGQPPARGYVPEAPTGQTARYCITPDDVRIAYACTGAGPPLVKAANWLNHLELDWVSPAWGRMFTALSQHHLFVRYDERGNGLSDWEVDDISFDAFVSDLESVVDHLGLERFPLLGISQGGAVSIEYAARHPERVSALILIGGYAAGWRVTADAQTRAQREAIITLVRYGWGANNPVYRQLFSQTFMPSATPQELDWFNEYQRQTATPENAVRFLQAFADIDVRHRLAGIEAPTLVLHARGDQRIPLSEGIDLTARIRNASLVTLDTDSHVPLAREPATEVAIERIHAFLREVEE